MESAPIRLGASSQSLGNLFRKLANFFRKRVNFFGNEVNLFRNRGNLFREQYSNTSYNWRSCLPCTALPFSHTAAYPRGVRHSMYCAQSSKWGLFGRNTRSAIQGTTSRSSVGEIGEGIREGKETAILIKRTFCHLVFLGRPLVLLWFVVGSSLVFDTRLIRKVQEMAILIKSLFRKKVPEYYSGVMNKEK